MRNLSDEIVRLEMQRKMLWPHLSDDDFDTIVASIADVGVFSVRVYLTTQEMIHRMDEDD